MKKSVLKIIGIFLIIVVLVLSYFVYNTLTQFKKLNKGEIVSNIELDTIPFTYSNSGHIIIDVKVQGSEKPYPFILDSGAPSFIFTNHLKEFDLTSNGWALGKGSTGNWTFNRIKRVESLSLGKFDFENLNVESQAFRSSCSDEIYGFLGIGIMKHLVWQIDFKKSIILVSKRLEDLDFSENKIEIPLTEGKYGHHLNVSLRMRNTKFKKSALVDLGSNTTLSLKEDHILEESLALESKIIYGIGSEGLGGTSSESSEKIYLLDTLYFSYSNLTSINIPIHTSPKGLNMLGLDFFKNYITTISWTDKKLILEPYDSAQTYIWNNFGFSLKFDSKLDKVIVKSVTEETPASNAGLPLNADVISIGEYQFTDEASLCSYRRLKTKKDTISLKTKYEGVISEYQLVRQPIFSISDK